MQALIDTLNQIEQELKTLDLWSDSSPTAAALASTQPFCIDTLSLPEWLQFVFLPRMHALIEAQHPLPQRCGIAPIAEEHFKQQPLNFNQQAQIERLLSQLQTIDTLLTEL